MVAGADDGRGAPPAWTLSLVADVGRAAGGEGRRGGRLPLLALGFLALVGGLIGGLARSGVPLPEVAAALAGAHGPLMVVGFFGTVIGLERAVALAPRRWPFAAPALSGGAGLVLLAGGEERAAAGLAAAAGLVLLAGGAVVLRRQLALFTATMTGGALAFLVGSLLWLAAAPAPVIALWWAAFLVLTIAGERLELSRVLGHSGHRLWRFGFAVGLLALGLIWATLGGGVLLVGVGLLALALWLATYDVARRTVRQRGFVRYAATALLLGYGWLAVAGAIALFQPALTGGGFAYDAFLHALFLGFVFSMVFAHAPIILPAVLGVRLPFTPLAYLPLAFLHLSVLARLAADALASADGRAHAGVAATAAIALFLVISAAAVRRRPPPP